MALPDYTLSYTGHVARVWPGDGRHQHIVIMRDKLRNTSKYYTWSDWQASFCEEAAKADRAVTLDWSRTSWGSLIINVDWAPPSAEPAA